MVPLDSDESGQSWDGFMVAKTGSSNRVDLRHWRVGRHWPGLAHGWSGAGATGRRA